MVRDRSVCRCWMSTSLSQFLPFLPPFQRFSLSFFYHFLFLFSHYLKCTPLVAGDTRTKPGTSAAHYLTIPTLTPGSLFNTGLETDTSLPLIAQQSPAKQTQSNTKQMFSHHRHNHRNHVEARAKNNNHPALADPPCSSFPMIPLTSTFTPLALATTNARQPFPQKKSCRITSGSLFATASTAVLFAMALLPRGRRGCRHGAQHSSAAAFPRRGGACFRPWLRSGGKGVRAPLPHCGVGRNYFCLLGNGL